MYLLQMIQKIARRKNFLGNLRYIAGCSQLIISGKTLPPPTSYVNDPIPPVNSLLMLALMLDHALLLTSTTNALDHRAASWDIRVAGSGRLLRGGPVLKPCA